MMLRRPLPCLLLLLSACAARQDTRYPSLLPRPIETRDDAEPAAAPPAAPATDPALDSRLSGIAASLDATARDFAPAARQAETAARAARGQRAGSERWITAQTALATLDGYRASLSSALGEIDQIAIERAAAGQPDYAGLAPLRTRAQTGLDEATARINAIQAMLPAS